MSKAVHYSIEYLHFPEMFPQKISARSNAKGAENCSLPRERKAILGTNSHFNTATWAPCYILPAFPVTDTRDRVQRCTYSRDKIMPNEIFKCSYI